MKIRHTIYRDFFSCKKMKINSKKFDILNIFVPNIDCVFDQN